MWPGRIAFAVVLLWSAFCLALAAVVFVNLRRIESPERYIALGLGLVMPFHAGRQSRSVVVAGSSANTSAARNGNDITIRFTATVPVIATRRAG